ncbi:N-acetylglucosamine-6-phosphate deacetylase [Leptothrix sp. BB-4]
MADLRGVLRLQGRILTPEGFVDGFLVARDGRIQVISGARVPTARALDTDGPILLPGFIDLHVHGGANADVMQGGDAATRVARCHARYGTTSLLATTMTAAVPDLRVALSALAPPCAERPPGTARILGVHLEAPFRRVESPDDRPGTVRRLDFDELDGLAALAPVRLITLAPEIPGHLDLIGRLRERGIAVQIGHSAGSYDDGVAALERGAVGFTHLFNAMSGLHHREPGMVGAALAHAQHAEVIPDLQHVHPGALRVALRCIPGLYCVTDSASLTGLPDGEYPLGRRQVFKCLGGLRLANGALAGSTLTMDQALRNLVSLGLSLRDASRRVSTHAADYLGLTDRGRLGVGARADIVVLDRQLALQRVFVEGEEIALEAEGD